MHDNKDHKGKHTQKVQTAPHLAPAEQLDILGETGGDSRRHCGTSEQHKWSEQKDDPGVSELLKRIIRLKSTGRRYMQGDVGAQSVEGVGEDRPGGRKQTAP